MSYQDPNQQGQYPNSGQYGGGYNPQQPPSQPQPTDPYSGQQYQPQPGQGTGYQQPGGDYQQQQPYGQPGYQQPNYGQTPYGAPNPNAGSTMNIEPNLAAFLSYLLGWIGGLVFFLMEKRNRFVRFHAMQSIMLTGAQTILIIILNIIGNAPGVGFLSCIVGLLSFAVWIGFLVGWIICMVNAFQGKYFKLPIIGDYAERYANQGTI